VAEPMTHYLSPPVFTGYEGKSLEAGEKALRYSYFHWTFHTCGCYAGISLAIAIGFYNSRRSFKVSAGLMLEAFSTGIGDYFQNLIGMSLYAEPMYKTGWVGNWSDFYRA
jgi:glycine betaine transporter